ncbi:hypothetical protein Rs2_11263 [Raphanus sativus]|uniref:Uncharacterized protein LOC108844527 n=1 Tax=Raphanus sativus TaxID=3726 RepID=A0A6J0MLC8_RAPSA|nr:uncharacterized protein LOC108844527 [Raphanus sativus]XP_056857251.1 uncharacterized protein LOC130506591 [Raphanus sativus]KAJ4866738.1 hypothetical protein Rs2_51728 [Raphanus sativus]KAJ4907605.1 hypothetical protein Rs2_11263 [Raphanus sativus]
MGACASTPKESDILETPATTENAVVEPKNVETETVSQEKGDEVVAEKKEESTVDEAETPKEPEPANPSEVVKSVEAVKTQETLEAAGETEPPKQEEAEHSQ